MNLQITGKVIEVLGIVSGTSASNGKEWKKQDFVIETVVISKFKTDNFRKS